MNYEELLSNANLAFSSGQYKLAEDLSEKAISINKKSIEGYICSGKALMSLGEYEKSTEQFKKSTLIDPSNGFCFYLLGYAQAICNKTVQALNSLTKAIELNCDNSIKGQIYKMISMINAEQGDYDNALINLQQAEDFLGLDYEILQQKAACYTQKNDYKNTLFVLNNMKLLKPDNYDAYNLAFSIFMELEIYDEAKAELERAEKFADLTMQYYNDRVAYILLHDPSLDTKENISQKWKKTIEALDFGLHEGNPNANDVFDFYMRAAQLYISLNNPQKAVEILNAAIDPVYAYNNGFSILSDDILEDSPSTELSNLANLSPADEEALMQEKYENGEFDDIREVISDALFNSDSIDSDELSEEIHQYLTPTDVIPTHPDNQESYLIKEDFKMDQVQSDMRNSMYISAYEEIKDYDKMLQKARELQSSSIAANQYCGIYYELKVGKYTIVPPIKPCRNQAAYLV